MIAISLPNDLPSRSTELPAESLKFDSVGSARWRLFNRLPEVLYVADPGWKAIKEIGRMAEDTSKSYEDMTKEERQSHDAKERERERQEQAGESELT